LPGMMPKKLMIPSLSSPCCIYFLLCSNDLIPCDMYLTLPNAFYETYVVTRCFPLCVVLLLYSVPNLIMADGVVRQKVSSAKPCSKIGRVRC
jgi:hypothetical protein